MRLLIIFISFLLISCSKDEYFSDSTNRKKAISGSWSLIHFSPGLAPSDSYQVGNIVWDFKPESKLTVIINVDLTGKMIPIANTGEYTFEQDDDKIILNDMEYDYSINDDSLTISNHPEVDGPQLKFVSLK